MSVCNFEYIALISIRAPSYILFKKYFFAKINYNNQKELSH